MEWLAAIVGALVATLATLIGKDMLFTDGNLLIDHTNPEKDVYRFEIDNLDSIRKKKRITLKIDHNADLSQK